jgi:hypothetical protein
MHKNSTVLLLSVLVIFLGLSVVFMTQPHRKAPELAIETPISMEDKSIIPEGSGDAVSVEGWNTFSNKFGMSLKYPNGWTVDDASYESKGEKALFVWIYGPKRTAPEEYGYTQAQFKMPVCYMEILKDFTNKCYRDTEELALLYPGGTQSPNDVHLEKKDVQNTDEYKTAMKILETATLQ